jgi:hypothetical protein
MSVKVPRGEIDASIQCILEALEAYEADHPGARIELYRRNPASIRVRVIDEDFLGVSRSDRHNRVWSYLQTLPDEVQSQVSLLIPVTAGAMKTSPASLEFDGPVPAILGS